MVGGEARTGLFMNWEYIQIRFCQISTILSLEDFIEMGDFVQSRAYFIQRYCYHSFVCPILCSFAQKLKQRGYASRK